MSGTPGPDDTGARSAPSTGSTVTTTVTTTTTTSSGGATGASSSPAVTRVLVVDDTEGNRYSIGRFLRAAGMEVMEAASGAEARVRLAEAVPDLAVLDINLPDITGFELCREIKTAPATASVPVLHVSASYVSNADRAYGLDHGADAYLTHPLTPDVFIATVRALLRVGRAETEMRRLYVAEQAARAEAEEASLAKTQLLSTLSHELRTPLNSIRGHLDLVDADVYGPVTDAQREAIGRATRSAVYLSGLIDDMLNFARLDSGKLDFETSDVPIDGPGGVISDVLALVAMQSAQHGVTLVHDEAAAGDTPPEPVRARADVDKVRIIVTNLLVNAIKFTPDGGSVRIACARDREAGTVSVRVTDTGRGIAPEQLERIFEPFVQVDRYLLQQSQQGVGLGLSIARTLAVGMGGDLVAESRRDAGSVFTLTLPAAEQAAAEQAAAEQPVADRPAAG